LGGGRQKVPIDIARQKWRRGRGEGDVTCPPERGVSQAREKAEI